MSARGGIRLRDHALRWGTRTYVMGIVNVTPDSFSGDGLLDPDEAATRALAQRAAGADILDIGAQSSRPGSTPIEPAIEATRLLPALAAVRRRDARTPISVDTSVAAIYRQAHAAGADILNVVGGVDDELLAVCVETVSPLVIMHTAPHARYDGDVVDIVLRVLARTAERAVHAGLPPSHVLLDPGIGFGKTPEHNLALLSRLDRLVALGFPTLIGTSRKSTIGVLTGRAVAEREFGTAATVALAVAAGIDVVRVHDVAAQGDVVRVADAITRGWRPPGWRVDGPNPPTMQPATRGGETDRRY